MITCPLCNSKMEYEDTNTDDHNGTVLFPDMFMDYWCDKGHLVQAIACENATGWQVIIMDQDGEELFGLWYDTKRKLVDITDWQTGAQVWAP